MGLGAGALALCCATLMATGAARAAGEADEAWIAAYMARGGAPGTAASDPREADIAFDRLDDWQGRRVRVVLRDGRERRGIVEGVDGQVVLLRTQLDTGFFRYGIARADVRAIRED